MNWKDEAIILHAIPQGESAACVTLFTQAHGAWRGYVPGGRSKSKRHSITPGNLVNATWQGRLSEQLGHMTLDVIYPTSTVLFHDAKRLNAMNAVLALLYDGLPERLPHPTLYELFKTWAMMILKPTWLEGYIQFELEFLTEMGFGLSLEQCIATGTRDNLCWVSPKSGSAVCYDAGLPYKEKLLPLPKFLWTNKDANSEDILSALHLTGYFLNRLFTSLNKPTPKARMVFLDTLKRP